MTLNLSKIDKFYVAFVIILILLSVLIIVTFRGIFSAYIDAYEINPADISTKLNINYDSLDEAYNWVVKK